MNKITLSLLCILVTCLISQSAQAGPFESVLTKLTDVKRVENLQTVDGQKTVRYQSIRTTLHVLTIGVGEQKPTRVPEIPGLYQQALAAFGALQGKTETEFLGVSFTAPEMEVIMEALGTADQAVRQVQLKAQKSGMGQDASGCGQNAPCAKARISGGPNESVAVAASAAQAAAGRMIGSGSPKGRFGLDPAVNTLLDRLMVEALELEGDSRPGRAKIQAVLDDQGLGNRQEIKAFYLGKLRQKRPHRSEESKHDPDSDGDDSDDESSPPSPRGKQPLGRPPLSAGHRVHQATPPPAVVGNVSAGFNQLLGGKDSLSLDLRVNQYDYKKAGGGVACNFHAMEGILYTAQHFQDMSKMLIGRDVPALEKMRKTVLDAGTAAFVNNQPGPEKPQYSFIDELEGQLKIDGDRAKYSQILGRGREEFFETGDGEGIKALHKSIREKLLAPSFKNKSRYMLLTINGLTISIVQMAPGVALVLDTHSKAVTLVNESGVKEYLASNSMGFGSGGGGEAIIFSGELNTQTGSLK